MKVILWQGKVLEIFKIGLKEAIEDEGSEEKIIYEKILKYVEMLEEERIK